MKRIDSLVLYTLIAIMLAFSYVQVAFGLKEQDVPARTEFLWMFVFAMLVAIWTTKEPKFKEFNPPFEFGAFVYFFWPVFLPYYLCKTRGSKGLVLFVGFVVLYYIPFLSGLMAYVFYT